MFRDVPECSMFQILSTGSSVGLKLGFPSVHGRNAAPGSPRGLGIELDVVFSSISQNLMPVQGNRTKNITPGVIARRNIKLEIIGVFY